MQLWHAKYFSCQKKKQIKNWKKKSFQKNGAKNTNVHRALVQFDFPFSQANKAPLLPHLRAHLSINQDFLTSFNSCQFIKNNLW